MPIALALPALPAEERPVHSGVAVGAGLAGETLVPGRAVATFNSLGATEEARGGRRRLGAELEGGRVQAGFEAENQLKQFYIVFQ